VLQNDDVLDIEPAGPELAITGSVNFEAIYEAKPGETLADIIRYAGGLNSLADDKRLVLVRLGDLDLTGSRELSFAQAQTFPAERGDIVRILSLADIVRPRERQAILATIDGEVDHPGRYYLKPGSTLADLIAQANGLTSGAFVFGADFSRESVRRQQQVSFDKAIDDLEVDAAAAPISALASADNAASAQARQQASLAVIQHLKERKPDGRLVLDTPYEATALPGALALEDNDHIYIPPRPTTVGVFGAVYRTGSFLFRPGGRIGDYLKMTGGAQRFADRGATFVVRANGAVVSARQVHDLNSRPALPGDVIYVPVQTGPSLWEKLKEIAQVVFQFGLGAAALAVLAHQ
jgi:protein involved in polysaccharide export with SLBB domain